MQALRQSRRIVSLRQLISDLEQKRLTDDAVAITFDDGYSDNFHAAKPLLEQYSASATFFLATGYIGRQEFWWDELERLVFGAGELSPEMLRKNFSLRLDGSDVADRPTLGQRARVALRHLRGPHHHQRIGLLLAIWRRLRPLSEYDQRCFLDELAALLGAASSDGEYAHRPLDGDEARSLARNELVEIGAHSVSHPMMSRQPPASQYDELLRSRAACEALAGSAPVGFAYPYGDMGDDTAALVRRAGFKYACSTIHGALTSDTDSFRLPRVTVRDWSGQELVRVLT